MKTVMKLGIALLVVVLLIAGGVLFYLDSLAKNAIEYSGTRALGVETRVESVNISLFGGEASLSDLQIDNPGGFSQPQFLTLGRGELAVSLGSLRGETVIIPWMHFADILVNLEQKNKTNNVQPLMARARSLGGSGESSSPPAESSGKKFVLEHLAIENIQVNALLDLLGQTNRVNLVLPKIELRDLGKEQGGLPMPELIQKIVQAVLAAVEKSSAGLSPELASLLKGELGGLQTVKTELIGKAQAEVDKKIEETRDKMSKELEKLPLPEGTEKSVEEKAGKLLKGVLDK